MIENQEINEIVINKSDVTPDFYNELYFSLRWLRGNSGRDYAIIRTISNKFMSTNKFAICCWEPDWNYKYQAYLDGGGYNALTLIPEGYWNIEKINKDIMILNRATYFADEWGFPKDLNLERMFEDIEHGTIENTEADKVRINFGFSPNLLADLCGCNFFLSAKAWLTNCAIILNFDINEEIVKGKYTALLMLRNLVENGSISVRLIGCNQYGFEKN